jgi:hypothetical protein
MLCAFCNDFLLNALGYQCEDCRYTCHKKCYEKVVTKCISKSNTGVSMSIFFGRSCLSLFCCRMVMKKKSTIVSHIGLNLSLTWEQIGAATAVICSPLVERTRANAQSVTSLATPTVRTLSLISAVCRWRQPISCCANGVTSTRIRLVLARWSLLSANLHNRCLPSRILRVRSPYRRAWGS